MRNGTVPKFAAKRELKSVDKLYPALFWYKPVRRRYFIGPKIDRTVLNLRKSGGVEHLAVYPYFLNVP